MWFFIALLFPHYKPVTSMVFSQIHVMNFRFFSILKKDDDIKVISNKYRCVCSHLYFILSVEPNSSSRLHIWLVSKQTMAEV